ncbi:gamma-glutamylcyclotransferase family protein [Stappia indica]|uniref:gamma-glutamylcyclotransferase family protein n=1 Tax=Stappia indica TaxID=538381 RepID=UPI001CD573A5|nr:gamma-glutamylcyclotransferase family protein [Stappia indica]MCA1298683.1 gamma-glutamylcyclotransferase [Stappia indica]
MTITYFGYGSLVNVRTLDPAARATPGTLAGWRREWRAWWTEHEGPRVCTLTVVPDPDCAIDGVMVSEPAEGLAVLQQRERRYERIDGIGSQFRGAADGAPAGADAFLFQADTAIRKWGDETHPILQSYVDCVLAGFHAFWGEEGVARFIASTHGWHAPILADRAAPRYPRAQAIDAGLLARFDEMLAGEGVRYLAPAD